MNKLGLIIFAGILIRLFLAASTFHPDIQAFNLAGKVVGEGNILNLYDYLSGLSSDNPLKNIAVFNYPPAIYFLFGTYHFIVTSIFNIPLLNEYILDLPSNYGNILFNLHLLFLKLPYLFFDLGVGVLLYKLFGSKKEKLLAFSLWIFNPINLYATYMMGQFDIIPTFFMVAAIYYIVKEKLYLASLLLGFGIAFKIFPIFLLVPLLVITKGINKKIMVGIIALVPYLLSILPYLSSEGFKNTALFANQSSKSLYASIPVSGGESILLFPTFLIFFYLIIWKKGIGKIWSTNLNILLLFFIFTHFHPQWLIWLTPFLIINLVKRNFENILAVGLLFISYIGMLLFFDSSLTMGIFAPIFYDLKTMPDIWTLINIKMDYNFSRSLLQSIFVSAAIYLIYQTTQKEHV